MSAQRKSVFAAYSWLVSSLFKICEVLHHINWKVNTPEKFAVQWTDSIFFYLGSLHRKATTF
jgi:hypothetical protein